MTTDDINGVIVLQKRAFPKMPPWTRCQLASHLKHFPEGQFVALDTEGRVIGSASSLIIDWDGTDDLASWDAITGRGTFKSHNPEKGRSLYAADVGVDPDCRGMGVGAKLYEARRALAKKLNLKRIVAGGRLPGYGEVADEMTAEQYVAEVESGLRKDIVLSFQLANGFRVRGVIPGYLACDKASKGYATLLEWLNPTYHERPGATVDHRLAA